jgi:AdoMet-dependent heme synthase
MPSPGGADTATLSQVVPTESGRERGTHPGGGDMSAMTKGCLAGQAVCFVSHTGEVFPCGYLPVSSGNVKDSPLPLIWRASTIFAHLRDDTNLEGKCGMCEYKKVCMGCRARAYAESHDYLAEEPRCGYTPLRLRR